MASRISGNAIMASISRAIGVSSFWKKPASRPSVMPINADSATTAAPTRSDSLPAKMVREKTSRPNSSVPNQ
ncbi:hypothetical protein D3C80_2112540 [compost metagenome]